MSVASITTAHNAARLLPRQMEALLSQTRPLQEIVVVDNASSDGTAEMLADRYPQITVLRMPENLGAAGAWAAGLAYAALEKRHEWIWTFDDDNIPDRDALGTLLKGLDLIRGANGEVGMVADAASPSGNRNDLSAASVARWLLLLPSPELFQKQVWFADLAYASGSHVVRREVTWKKIGLPRADFFMDFFDFEYCLRARSQDYKIRCNSCREICARSRRCTASETTRFVSLVAGSRSLA